MDFWGVYDVNIWGKNFARSTGKSTDNNDINIFLSLENPCTFLLANEKTWKRIFNPISELSQNSTKKNYAIQNNNKLAIWYMSMRLFYRAPFVATSPYTHYLFKLDWTHAKMWTHCVANIWQHNPVFNE